MVKIAKIVKIFVMVQMGCTGQIHWRKCLNGLNGLKGLNSLNSLILPMEYISLLHQIKVSKSFNSSNSSYDSKSLI